MYDLIETALVLAIVAYGAYATFRNMFKKSSASGCKSGCGGGCAGCPLRDKAK